MTSTSTRARVSARATTADALLVARRRAGRDRGLVLGSAVLLVVLLVVTLAVPRLLERAADVAVRAAVATAGADADIVALPRDRSWDLTADEVQTARDAASRLQSTFRTGVAAPVLTVWAPPVVVPGPSGPLLAQLEHAGVPSREDPDDVTLVRWVAGDRPEPVPSPGRVPRIEVGLSAAAAQDLGVTLDDGPWTLPWDTADPGADVVVTGLYEPTDPGAAVWRSSPALLGTVPATVARGVDTMVALYVPRAALGDLQRVSWDRPLLTRVRLPVDTGRLTVAQARELTRTAERETASGLVSTRLPDVVEAFEARLVAARAHASLTVVAIAVVGALCLVLAGGLLVHRRWPALSLERARGSSVAGVALRALVETVPVVLLAGVVAGAVVVLTLPGPGTVTVAVALAVVAAAAPPVAAARAAAGAWAGRRGAADRDEQDRRATHRAARRLGLEGLVVALAVVAVVAVRGRGLVPIGDGQVDLLLAGAPVLVAGAAAVLVARVVPAVVLATSRLAARSRGLAVPLAAARAQAAPASVTAVLAVTLAAGLVVQTGMLVHAVRAGQGEAADLRVGADARLDGRLDEQQARTLLASLRAADGVDAVAAAAQLERVSLGVGTGVSVTLLVVDAAELARLRTAFGLPVDPGLRDLAAAHDGTPAGAVPVLVTGALLDRLGGPDAPAVDLFVAGGRVPVDLRGRTTLLPDGGAPSADVRALAATTQGTGDGLVVVDRARLAAATGEALPVDRVWVAGPGAAAAVDAPDVLVPGVTVTTRDGWALTWSSEPLPRSLVALQLGGLVALTVLLVLTLVLVAVATSPDRGRTLAVLRTLGIDPRTARAVTVGELAPPAVAGLVAGAVAGVAVPWLVADALGLAWVTGDPRAGHAALSGWPVAVAAVAVLVAVAGAVAVEGRVRRADRIGEVLRSGQA